MPMGRVESMCAATELIVRRGAPRSRATAHATCIDSCWSHWSLVGPYTIQLQREHSPTPNPKYTNLCAARGARVCAGPPLARPSRLPNAASATAATRWPSTLALSSLHVTAESRVVHVRLTDAVAGSARVTSHSVKTHAGSRDIESGISYIPSGLRVPYCPRRKSAQVVRDTMPA